MMATRKRSFIVASEKAGKDQNGVSTNGRKELFLCPFDLLLSALFKSIMITSPERQPQQEPFSPR